MLSERTLLRAIIGIGIALVVDAAAARTAAADGIIKIGIVVPLTGAQGVVGKQISAAARLYVQQHGDIVAGKKIELIIRDDGGAPDNSKRLAQELIVNDNVGILGAGLTPNALAIAPLATEAKVATVVMVSGTSFVTERSPFFVRTSFTLGQQASIIAEWAAKNGSKNTVIVQSDWAPGAEATTVFTNYFTRFGGHVLEIIKVPLANPDFAPFLQRARDLNPDTLFVFVPSHQAGTFAKQFVERGMDKAGIRLIGPGDITDDYDLPGMSNAVIGTVTAGNYSVYHQSEMNKAYVEAFQKANGFRPNFITLGGWDGMHLIYEALKKTNGSIDADALITAMKGMKWDSPRGPVSIDPETRDIIQNVYIRRVERVEGELQNVEFATFEAVKDPIKAAKR